MKSILVQVVKNAQNGVEERGKIQNPTLSLKNCGKRLIIAIKYLKTSQFSFFLLRRWWGEEVDVSIRWWVVMKKVVWWWW